MGIALGCVGLSYDDFCRLEFDEFTAIYEAYASECDLLFKDNWNRMRMHACISMQPHLSKGKRLTPQGLLPFPWDNDNKQNVEILTKEKDKERVEELLKKLK